MLSAIALELAAGVPSALAVAWNGTDPDASAVSANGLTDNYGEFTNECVVTNTAQGEFGTGTYLGNGWVLTALHVVSGSTYGVTVPGNEIQVNIYGQIYTVDQYQGWGSSDIQLIHLSGYTSGTAANLTGVERSQIYTGSSETGNLMQLGGFGVHGLLNSGTDVNNETFHRGFNLGVASGGVVTTYADGSSRLVQDGYLLGYQQGGDSGSALWMDNGPDQDLDLRDWSLIGSLVNGSTPGYFGNNGQYARTSTYAAGIISTVFPNAWLTWNANNASTTASDGSGTWNLTTAQFTDGTNYAYNGPERTQQVTFGAGSGAAGTVTLGATVPVDQMVFNAAGSGSYTIAGAGTYSLDMDAGAVITTNVNATISANITGGASTQYGAEDEVTKNGTASLTLTGQTNLGSGAYFHDRAGTVLIAGTGSFNLTNGYTSVGLYTGEHATLTVEGSASYSSPGQDFNLGDLGGTGVLNVQNSATLTVGQLYVGKGSSGATGAAGLGTVNQSGGVVTAGNFVSVGTLNTGSFGTYNLNGGTLITGQISQGVGRGAFNFNGGTVQAASGAYASTFMQGLYSATIGTGGVTFNSNGYGITVGQSLVHGGSTADGGLTKSGVGTLSLTGSNTYTGPTLVSAGALALGGAGSVNSSSGITVNGTGASFVQLSSVPVAPPITVTTGTLDGIGAVGAVSVGDGTGGAIANGNGTVGALTLSSLTFNGEASDTVRLLGGAATTTPGQIVTNTLTTPASSGAVTLNVGGQGFNTGTYDLVQYGNLAGGGLSSFALGTTAGLGNNQTASLGNSGSDLTLSVGGYLDQYTGAANSTWSTAATASPYNYHESSSPATGVNYADGDAVLFDDTPGSGAHAVNLGTAVAPAWTTFNNSSANYTINSTGGYGIGGAGGITKNGAGSVTLSTVNTFTGPVVINGGTLGAVFTTNPQTGAFNNVSSITVNSGGILLTSENGLFGYTGSNERPITLNAGATLNSSAASASTHLGALTLAGGTLAYPSATPTGDGAYYGSYNLDQGVVAGGSATTSTISAADVALTQTGGTVFNVAAGTTTSGIDLNVSGTLVHPSSGVDTGLIKTGSGTMQLSGTNSYTGATVLAAGQLKVTGSLTATNSIAIGNTANVGAAMYQSGGAISATSTALGGIQVGAAPLSAGYYNLSGGTLGVAGEIDVGGSGGGGTAPTFGEFDMTGGIVNLPNSSSSYFLVNRGLAGESSVVNIAGTVQIAGGGTPADNGFDGLAINWSEVAAAQTATITIAGGGQFLTPSLAVKVNNGGNNTYINGGDFGGFSGNPNNVATLNLGAGGILQALGFITNDNDSSVSLNFNGGTLKAGTAANATFLQNLGGTYVYGGGGTIDNNGRAITIGQAISSPVGLGVSGVVIGGGGSGYVVPPQVSFSGGGGSGATGYATVDPITGAVTGIVITNPGTGYTSAPTVTLTANGGGSGASVGAVATASNTPGAISFQGSGTTTLSGASTFTGNVIVNGGTVDAANDVNVSGRTNGALGNPSVAGRTVTINNGGAVVFTVGNVLGTGSQSNAPGLSFIVNQGGLLETAAADVGAGGGGDANIFGNIVLNGGTMTAGNGANADYQSVILLGSVSTGGTAASTINTNATNTTDNGVMLGAGGGVTFNVGKTGVTGADLVVSAPLVNAAGGSATGSLIKTGPGTMLLSGANTYTGLTTVAQGWLVLDSPAQAPVLRSGGANVEAGALVFDYSGGSDPVALVRSDLAASYSAAGGAFSSGQIYSSTAVADKFGLGYVDDTATDQVTVMYTLYGDTNLDGSVNFADLLTVAQYYGESDTDWAEGDFNYDGSTNFSDLLLLAQNYDQSLSSSQASELDQIDASFVQQWDLAEQEAAVPEPASLAVLVIGGALVSVRRKRTNGSTVRSLA